MTGQQRLPDPVEGRDESCRDVLRWAQRQTADALAEVDRVRAVLAPAYVYLGAWLERHENDDAGPNT